MTMKNELKVVLFDMGKVLVHIDVEAFPRALGLVTPEQRAPYLPAAKNLEQLYEKGKLSTDEFFNALYPLFECTFPKKTLHEAYNGIIINENSEIVPFVRKVKEQYKIALLSNTNESHWKKSLEIAPVLSLFTDRFTSFDIGEMKPVHSVYRHVIDRLNVDASSILFIDDIQENIDSAIECGMQGIVYTSVEQLQHDAHVRRVVYY
jgi:HAD superfamily hydrolase (TIGR01509 family)